jgi:hypothetical protein
VYHYISLQAFAAIAAAVGIGFATGLVIIRRAAIDLGNQTSSL